MEMTGLDVEKEVPIEIAAIITDLDFKEGETFHAIIKQPQPYLNAMDEWNTKHHGESGLTKAVATGVDPAKVEADLIAYIDRNFTSSDSKERPVLAGNSIGQDRLFIDRHMPRLAARLHYRMLDVTSWKIMMNERYKIKYEKKNSHRAIDDIRESIGELAFYLSRIEVR